MSTPAPPPIQTTETAAELREALIEHFIGEAYLRSTARSMADELISGPLASHLAAADTLRRERDEARAESLSHQRARSALLADVRRAERRAAVAEANLLGIAKMYGEACCELVRLHMALDWDDVAWGMYSARRDRERIAAAEASAAADRETVERVEAALDDAMKRGIRAWANRLHVPVTRMMSAELRKEIRAALNPGEPDAHRT